MRAYCWTTGHRVPAAASIGAMKSGGRVRCDVGWVAWMVIDLDTTEAGESSSFTADDQYDVGLSGGDGVEGIVDDLLL